MFDQSRPEQFKQATQASFDTTAPTYGTAGDFHWQFAQRLLAYAPLATNQTLLDVATGTAPAARLAAHQVLPQGFVVATDLSLGILQHAKHNITSDSSKNIALLCADAEHLPFRATSVDGIVCSSSIVWFPNYTSALYDWHRVLRCGGWIAFSCFGGAARQTLITLLSQLLEAYSQHLPELNAPFNTPEKCRALLEACGYTNIAVYTGTDTPLPSTTEDSFAWAWASHKRFGIHLNEEQLRDLQSRYRRSFGQLATTMEEWNHDYEQYIVAYKQA